MKTKAVRTWFRARQACLSSSEAHDFYAGLKVVRTCEQEEAKWLSNLFPADEPELSEYAICKRFEDLFPSSDGRAEYWWWMMLTDNGMTEERVSVIGQNVHVECAKKGYPLAQSYMGVSDGFDFWVSCMRSAIAHSEPEAMYSVWRSANNMSIVHPDYPTYEARCNLVHAAARLGYNIAIEFVIESFGFLDWEKYYWMRKTTYLHYMLHYCRLREFNLPMRAVYEIGKGLHGRLSQIQNNDEKISAWHRVSVYIGCCQKAHTAITLWTGARLLRVKDLRVLIARLVWKGRVEWLCSTNK